MITNLICEYENWRYPILILKLQHMNTQNITRDRLESITSSEDNNTKEYYIYRQMQEISLQRKSSNALDSLKHHHGGTICFWKIVLEYHHDMQRFQVFMMGGKTSSLQFYYLLFWKSKSNKSLTNAEEVVSDKL